MLWQTEPAPIAYEPAMARMDAHVRAMRDGAAEEMVWLVEHPPLYTLGTSADETDVLDAAIPHYTTGRGGQVTYHGPGQRVAYLMLDLNKRGKDVRAYVQQLERWIIATLSEFGVEGFTREGRIGVWVKEKVTGGEWRVTREEHARHPSPDTRHREAKIAALGVRVQGWVTSHGIALNVAPDLSHYAGIVPCGIREYGVTSLKALGADVSMAQVDAALRKHFPF